MTGRLPLHAALVALTAAAVAAAAGCQGGGNFCLFGYTTAPNFDPNIRSVYLPAFKNTVLHASPSRGVEDQLTQAIVDELGRRRSPIRVVSDPARADTELIGTVVGVIKNLQSSNILNVTREYQLQLSVEVVWRDLRTGRVLTGARAEATPPPVEPLFDPSAPRAPTPPPPTVALPIRLTSTGRVLDELGESFSSGQKMAVDRMARQIVNMMERPW